MRARGTELKELEGALRVVFPEGEIRLLSGDESGRASGHRADAEVMMGPIRLAVELSKSGSRPQLREAIERVRTLCTDGSTCAPMLASSYFSPSNQQYLRDEGIAFVDSAGNAWLMAPGIHVDRRGFANPWREEREQRDLFSDKASLVLRVLMMQRAPLGIRQIADIVADRGRGAFLSPGYVSKIVAELERRGYAGRRDDKVVLRHGRDLLSEWVVSYRKHARPTGGAYFMPSEDAESAMPRVAAILDAAGVGYVFSGHAGASLVDRHASFDVVDVHVEDRAAAGDALVRSGARQVERGGNINLVEPYYRVAAFYEYQVPRGSMRAASDIQLYLDLHDYPVRGREQADHLYERRLRSWIERDDEL